MTSPVYIMAAATTALIFSCMLLAALSTNYFGPVGLVLTLLASAVTMGVALKDAISAKRAAAKGIEPYEQITANRLQLFSKVMPQSDPLKPLDLKLQELRGDHQTLANYVDSRVNFLLRHSQSAHERLTYHEEVGLPVMLSKHAGTIILGAWLAILGAVAAYAPDHVYSLFAGLNEIGAELFFRLKAFYPFS